MTKLIDEISSLIEEHYLFPDAAAHVADYLRQQSYPAADPERFAQAVQATLTAESQDQHLRFWYAPEEAATRADHEQLLQTHFATARRTNFGFTKTECLEGNVGYLEIRELPPAEVAGEVAAAAMAFLAHTATLIIDLRQNGGGSPSMVQLLISYLVDEEPVELSGIHGRVGEPMRLFTLATISGQRRPEIPVYVLVGPNTHSAAEALAYDLQALQRATIVGEPTRGGAHPDRFFAIADQFLLTVPIAQALNPITGTNWEGTGVIPDVQTTAEKALEVAHRLALKNAQNNIV